MLATRNDLNNALSSAPRNRSHFKPRTKSRGSLGLYFVPRVANSLLALLFLPGAINIQPRYGSFMAVLAMVSCSGFKVPL
jgi:hypothetical protein